MYKRNNNPSNGRMNYEPKLARWISSINCMFFYSQVYLCLIDTTWHLVLDVFVSCRARGSSQPRSLENAQEPTAFLFVAISITQPLYHVLRTSKYLLVFGSWFASSTIEVCTSVYTLRIFNLHIQLNSHKLQQ